LIAGAARVVNAILWQQRNNLRRIIKAQPEGIVQILHRHPHQIDVAEIE
jgi:hypothetical protein